MPYSTSTRTVNALTKRSQVMLIAWPIILSNLSTPLLGFVDTAVIGNLGDPALLGAIAVGGMIFSFLYWGFGFLRMGTTGLVAQALGANNRSAASAAFQRAFALGIGIGLVLMVCQYPIASAAFSLIEGSSAVETAGLTYFQIRIWGAPVSLAFLAIMGYLLGCQDTRSILLLQLALNLTNIVLDIVFVVVLDWGVAGAAAATVIAEIVALVTGLCILVFKTNLTLQTDEPLADRIAIKRMFVVNRDIMIRTLCLIFAFAWFTNEGAAAGDVTLAANAILMQFVSFAAFFLDGYALAAESLVGHAVGRANRQATVLAMRWSLEFAVLNATLLCLLFAGFGTTLIEWLTNSVDVRDASAEFLPWAIAAPLTSVWCYLLDGIFIGATKTPQMRNAMIVSLLIFLASWWLLVPAFANHGLWLSLHIYFVARAVTLLWYLPSVLDTRQA